ncbi:DUF1501 domain-containing protein [Hirschia litorea]|uniref:DUF1501 domain-containing protein n=1 Tax=Hirschia litorea TaxID=1199156 RepID=A0ABW2INU9_9PROT
MTKDPTKISPVGRGLLDRRSFLSQTSGALGSLGLVSLLAQEKALAESKSGLSSDKTPIRPNIPVGNPYAPRPPHFKPAATQVLIIFCAGAVSHIDTFDYKPDLFKFHGTKPPGLPEVTFEGPSGNIHRPFWDFSPRGESGKMISDLLPHLGGLADDMCFFHGMKTSSSAHPPAENFMNTGFTFNGFPSIGAWATYALGSDNKDLPAFVAISDPRGTPRQGKNNWGNGFLPASFQGTEISGANPPPNIYTPESIGAGSNDRMIAELARMNERHMEAYPDDTELAARVASYELAGRMQMSVPEVTNIDNEPEYILEEYGINSPNKVKSAYAKNCLLARRLIEKGVRVVHLFNGASADNGINNWDSHSDLESTHGMQAEIMDQPTAAMITDMKRRGLLDNTLVVWCTEFGRAPFLQANGTGRDHNPGAFTTFMMGAGVKKGYSHGRSDELGFETVENMTEVYDFNATILHLLGLDHERLSYYYNGLERRLTNVHGHVVRDVLNT